MRLSLQYVFLVMNFMVALVLIRNITLKGEHEDSNVPNCRKQNVEEQINVEAKTISLHPSLKKQCYKYENLSATNICIKERIYTAKDIETCALRESQAFSSSTTVKQAQWVFLGNSRSRNLQFSICSIMDSRDCSQVIIWHCLLVNQTATREDCEKRWSAGEWTDFGHLRYIGDATLFKLESYLDQWLHNPDERPTRLHIGAGVNHMMHSAHLYNVGKGLDTKYRIALAARPWENDIRRIRNKLEELTKYIPVSWWVSEYTLKEKILEINKGVFAWENIDYYNAILRQELKGTNVSIMDSHVPLGKLYLEICTGANLEDVELCDVVHQGHECMQKYAQMYLNYACNQYFEPEY